MFKTAFLAGALALLTPYAASAQPAATSETEWHSITDVTGFFERYGFRTEPAMGPSHWLIAPSGDRILMTPVSDRGQTCCSGVRLEAMWLLGDSAAAEQAALYYESTNFLASLTLMRSESGTILRLQRDVLFARQRSADNIIGNASLLLQLIPHMQAALVDADPALPAFWALPPEDRR
ncbi:hypothetical protein [Maricaulis sp.]|uniref:hypothetical protein n=1 Tax=Maricaulis sp. TaxID=1486257 RepID=UPI003A907D88